jgi:hypothetical protein
LVVWKLDRLGRSVKLSWSIWSAICTSTVSSSGASPTPSTPAFHQAVLLPRRGEPCRNGARADRRAHLRGLEVAKQLGRKGGRKPKMTDSKIRSAKKLLASGVPPRTRPNTSTS